MAYVKVNRSFLGPGKRPVRSRRATKTKPKQEWVSTVHDLTVHRATPEELSWRREIHQSKNRAAAQLELRERAVRRSFRRSHPCSRTALDSVSQRITREQCQLQDALAQSDQAIALVKDLFGDAPRRHTGFPHVTVAPSCEPRSEVPLLQRAEPLTRLSVDAQTPNELDRDLEEEGSEDDPSPHSTWKRDTRRSNALLLQDACFHEERENGLLTPDPQAPCSCSSDPCHVSEDQQAALNATLQVRRVRPQSDSPSLLVSQVLNPSPATPKKPDKKTRPCGTSRTQDVSRLNSSALSSLSGNQSSLEVLQGMLGEVEEQLDSLAPHEAPEAAETQQGAPSLTGFSMSLVSSLGRLARHLRQSHEKVQKEVEHRKRVEEEVQDQRRLLDALTVESLSLREENTALQKHLKELEQRLDTLLLAAGGLGEPGGMGSKEESGPANGGACDSVTSHMDAAVSLEREVQEQVLLPPAVLLSPPRQMDSQPLSTQVQGCSLQCHGMTTRGSSAVFPGVEGRNERCDSHSIPSFASLPRLSPSWDPNTVLMHCQTSVSDPCRQHYWVGAQLEQLCSASLGGGGPQEQGTETRAACRVAASTAWQATLMEKRLQELNRQSAAARSKILELIEQQRQEADSPASPSFSPVPPAASMRTPQVAISLPERDLPVDSNYGGRLVR
ncbi:spindle and centriole-associated protein 1 isoform X1 [Scleropages formosus]|uniref:spindle and centriole-associated protein 1 isoform X1 n=1 Tax=Scleropages formosus TaxID=113540 RepID=UPI0010FA8424|nr:spindle and centriole-associated protein 1 isoform X1 [Scleropages formosus]XP_018616802.2 spindle and centriole-associated protein 1 isoform X1 [Scleropages formosus]